MSKEYRKRISQKYKMKTMNIVEWLHNSNIPKEQWIRNENDKIFQNSIRECTFHPNIDRKSRKTNSKK